MTTTCSIESKIHELDGDIIEDTPTSILNSSISIVSMTVQPFACLLPQQYIILILIQKHPEYLM